MKYIKRELEEAFMEANKNFKAIMVTGARQIGKTTMLEHLAQKQKRTTVTMDNEANRQLAKSDPNLFFQKFKPPILIDEAQKAPELFETIKIICDETDETGLFWLTGSQSRELLNKAGDTLAGRLAILKMYPFSTREKLALTEFKEIDFTLDGLTTRQENFPANDINETFQNIWLGGMPGTQNLSEKMLAVYYDSYINNYLIRDAVDDNGITDTEGFRKFLRASASFAGQLINYTDIATSAGISVGTAKAWIRILQNMGIVYLLEPYYNNELKRMIKTPKLYFIDTGLCAYLSRWTSKEVLMEGAASGHFYENYVVIEILKNISNNVQRANITFYRDRDGREVDVILEDDKGLHPFEIKQSTNPSKSEIRKFHLLEKSGIKLGNGGVICMCIEPFPIDDKNSLIPSNIL